MQPWDASTDDGAPLPGPGARNPQVDPEIALVIAWSAEEPWRAGEVAHLRDDGAPVLLGRGDARADDGCPRIKFFRERPGSLQPTTPLCGAGLSRRQLLFTRNDDVVDYERFGACDVVHNGEARQRGALAPGDTLRLGHQLLLYCVRRPPLHDVISTSARWTSEPFGQADHVGIVGESPAIWRLRADAAFAAAGPWHVLVMGESGSGKELVARCVHRWSARSDQPFVSRSAASFPVTLVDAELFGTARNYPNAGMPERPGLVGAAHQGMLFLDEVGELPHELQAHLLRVLDNGGEYHRLGDAVARRSDFRLVAATNRAIDSLKPDFAARFALHVRVPDLNEHVEDVPLLVRHMMRELRGDAEEMVSRFFTAGSDEPRVRPELLEHLLRRRYTTHVRELRRLLLHAVRASRSDWLDLAPDMATDGRPAQAQVPGPEIVRNALVLHGGNASRTTAELGLSSRYALYRLMKKYGIPRNGRIDS
jgi:two-component system nitrogen regulation response regulator GlnG/two-component system response regulator HydG